MSVLHTRCSTPVDSTILTATAIIAGQHSVLPGTALSALVVSYPAIRYGLILELLLTQSRYWEPVRIAACRIQSRISEHTAAGTGWPTITCKLQLYSRTDCKLPVSHWQAMGPKKPLLMYCSRGSWKSRDWPSLNLACSMVRDKWHCHCYILPLPGRLGAKERGGNRDSTNFIWRETMAW